MTAELAPAHFITVEEYLAGEELADQKHEYLAGVVYGMAGGTREHSAIASNLIGLPEPLRKPSRRKSTWHVTGSQTKFTPIPND